MNGNVVTASFQDGRITLTAPLWQYDYGQILRFTGVSLPETYEVHFSNTKDRGNAKTDEANASATAALNAKTAAQTAQIAAEAAQTLAESAAETAQSASENVEEKVADVVGIKQDLMMDHELTALLVDSTENNLTDSQGNRLETRVVFSDVDTVSALASELKASEQVTQRRIVDLETDVRKLCQGEEALGVHIDTVKADVEKLEGNLLIGQDITYQLLDNAGEPLLTGSVDALLGHTVFVSMDLLTVLANRVIALETLINAQK